MARVQTLKYTIAVVEDDEDILENLCSFLHKSGFEVWGVPSAEDFYVRLLRDRADLVIVDLGLPGEHGLDLVRRLVEQGVPVVIQTALGDVQDRIAGLEAGALQYFVKPTDLNEMVAGIRSLLSNAGIKARRTTRPQNKPNPTWTLDNAQTCLVAPNGKQVHLTSGEIQLMDLLIQNAGKVLSKPEVLTGMELDSGNEEAYHRIEALLSRLRRKTLERTGLRLPVRTLFGRGLAYVA